MPSCRWIVGRRCPSTGPIDRPASPPRAMEGDRMDRTVAQLAPIGPAIRKLALRQRSGRHHRNGEGQGRLRLRTLLIRRRHRPSRLRRRRPDRALLQSDPAANDHRPDGRGRRAGSKHRHPDLRKGDRPNGAWLRHDPVDRQWILVPGVRVSHLRRRADIGIDVNGDRLASCAGNYDDGESQNGALITLGGVDDTVDNPVDPNATTSPDGDDDELYVCARSSPPAIPNW